MVIQAVMGDDGGERGSIEGEEDRPQDRTLRDTTGTFDRIRLRAFNRHCLEPVEQIGLQPDGHSIVDSICVYSLGG